MTDDGAVYTWGDGRGHVLGHGTEDSEVAPRLVEALSSVAVSFAALGSCFAGAVTRDDGHVYTWVRSTWLGIACESGKQRAVANMSFFQVSTLTGLRGSR